MKLFCIKIKDTIGSFAPIELLEQTKNEIEQILSIKNLDEENLSTEEQKELENLKKQLLDGEILIATVSHIETVKLFEKAKGDNK